MIEVERKFVIDEGAELPGFESLAPSLRVGSVETLDLDAVYYDTSDYRLARTGAALRLRLGGNDPGWHLKVPGKSADTRVELRRPAPHIDAACLLLEPPAVPEELIDLTLARTGGRKLQPVVRLTTRRTRTVLVSPESRPLAEVDEDEVGAFLNGHSEPHDRWKELEIELLEGSPRELARIGRELERSGGRPAEYPSKFARAVGAAAGNPLVAEPRPSKSAADSVGWVFTRRWHDLVLELIERDVGVRLGDAEAVHRMRVAIRRLRSALRTFAPVLDKESARWLREELGWLGGVLGPLRDTDVLRSQLERLLDTLPASEVVGPVGDEIGSHFAEARQQALAAALVAMRSDRYLTLLNVLRAVSAAPPTRPKAKRTVNRAAPWLLRRDLERVERRFETARAMGAGAQRERALHEVRKAAKGMRYAAEAFEPFLGRAATRIAKRFEAIHELLGASQDAVVARAVLRELGAGRGAHPGHNGYTYGLLAGLEERRFADAASELPDLWESASRAKLWDALDR
ncbi:MAG: CHAD domain-containing protein [Acidimicrobiales bacterium]